jgi:hypothetical protein
VQEKLSELPFDRVGGGGGTSVGYKCTPILRRALFEFYTVVLSGLVIFFVLVNNGRVSRHRKLWTSSLLHNCRIVWTSLSSCGRAFHFFLQETRLREVFISK